MLKINNPGSLAKDFGFTDIRNRKSTLHQTRGTYVLRIFYDPACEACTHVIEEMKSSRQLDSLNRNGVTVLAIYTEGVENTWENYHSSIPANRINGMDIGKTILQNNLYDLKAKPILYLLDRDKKVILKDASFAEIMQYFRSRHF